MNENKLENATIKIGDGKLRLVENKVYANLSFKFICESLCEFFQDQENSEELVETIMNFLKEKREITMSVELKRFGICS